VRLVAYARTSSRGNGDSLEAQEEANREWAEANGHEVVAVRQDDPTQWDDCQAMAEREGWTVVGRFKAEGFSAYRGNRGPDLERAKRAAVAAAEEHGECMLVVQHSDRLARGAGDAPGAADHLGEVYFWARRHGVRLRSVQDDANLEDALRAVLIGERNTEDSKRKSEATRAVSGGALRAATQPVRSSSATGWSTRRTTRAG
jgi:DNA invertase Pin-like site-specific DNA recombinase